MNWVNPKSVTLILLVETGYLSGIHHMIEEQLCLSLVEFGLLAHHLACLDLDFFQIYLNFIAIGMLVP